MLPSMAGHMHAERDERCIDSAGHDAKIDNAHAPP